MPAEIYGPAGALVLLGLAVAALWRLHVQHDTKTEARLDRALDVSEAQVAATNRVADGQEELATAFREYIREQAHRRRQGEP